MRMMMGMWRERRRERRRGRRKRGKEAVAIAIAIVIAIVIAIAIAIAIAIVVIAMKRYSRSKLLYHILLYVYFIPIYQILILILLKNFIHFSVLLSCKSFSFSIIFHDFFQVFDLQIKVQIIIIFFNQSKNKTNRLIIEQKEANRIE